LNCISVSPEFCSTARLAVPAVRAILNSLGRSGHRWWMAGVKPGHGELLHTHHRDVAVTQAIRSDVLRARGFAPDLPVEGGKARVAFGVGVHFGEFDARRLRQGFPVDPRAADDGNRGRIVAPRPCQRIGERMDRDRTRCLPTRIAGKNDVRPAGKRLAVFRLVSCFTEFKRVFVYQLVP